MPKIPTPGQVVLFHFLEFASTDTSKQLRTRPATVVEFNAASGECFLYVMWWPGDRPATWSQALVLADFGVSMRLPNVGHVQRATDGIPADRTWTFRPEDL